MVDPTEYRAWLDHVALRSMHLTEFTAKAGVPFVNPATSEVCPSVDAIESAKLPDGAFVVAVSASVIIRGRVPANAVDPDAQSDEEVAADVGDIRANYAAIYTCPDDTSEEFIKVFKRNAVVHVWPLFRQAVRTTSSDFGWVPVVIAQVPVEPAADLDPNQAE